MSAADGAVIGTTQIFGGAPRNRAFNVVLLAEGFTNAQQNDFNNACTAFVNAFRATPPFDELSPAINIFRVNVSSTDSGADDPAAAGGTGASVRTYSMPPSAPTTSVGCWSATRLQRCRWPLPRCPSSPSCSSS
jgi:IgA Peptidase M64